MLGTKKSASTARKQATRATCGKKFLLLASKHDARCSLSRTRATNNATVYQKIHFEVTKLLHYFVIISYRKVSRFLSFSWVHVEVFYVWICKCSELRRKNNENNAYHQVAR